MRPSCFLWVACIALFLPCVTPQDPELDLATILERRVTRIRNQYFNEEAATTLLLQMSAEGTWASVDYTAGCPARRANWPAQDHLHNTLTMAAVWSTSGNPFLLAAANASLTHWLSNDFTSPDCINAGGRAELTCPCGTPGYWNTNWYCQMILIPGLVGSACLLLAPALTPSQLDTCSVQMARSWQRVDGDPNGSMGPMTGANLLDVASIAKSLAVLTNDHAMLVAASTRCWEECSLSFGPPTVDGIKVDGAFMQHDGQIYTGNYGKVFMNQMISGFLESTGTSLSPPPDFVTEAFTTLFMGSEWLMYRKGDQLSWSYSAIGRMVSHKWEDWSGIDLRLDDVLAATGDWAEGDLFREMVARLREPDGMLMGSRYFHTADFLVNRGPGYTTTLKMYSSRTTNSECNNGQNPYGYHLSDGTIYTQISGHEYTNVFGAWDWDLIPGTSSLYGGVPLGCSLVQRRGRDPLVGAVTLGSASLAVMTHVDPAVGNHAFAKTYFFFPAVYAVQFVNLDWNAGTMVTTLDQRQALGSVWVDGVSLGDDGWVENQASRTVWHDGVGYSFGEEVNLSAGVVARVANWSEIGISVGTENQTHFVAYVSHAAGVGGDEVPYVVRVGVDREEFESSPLGGVTLLPRSENVTGTTYSSLDVVVISVAFLSPTNYSTGVEVVPWIFVSQAPILLILEGRGDTQWTLGVADPSQTMVGDVHVAAEIGGVLVEKDVTLPTGPYAGSSVEVPIEV